MSDQQQPPAAATAAPSQSAVPAMEAAPTDKSWLEVESIRASKPLDDQLARFHREK